MNTKKYLAASIFLISVFFSFTSIVSVFAQGTPSEGKDFYLGFIAPTYNSVVLTPSRGYFKAYAIISSFQDNTVSVSYFEPGHGAEETPVEYKILKHQSVQIPLDYAKMRMPDPGDIDPLYRACHITAKKPVNVQFFSTGPCAGGSYLALPTSGLGKTYVIANWHDNPDGVGAHLGGLAPNTADKACGAFEIIGAFDGSKVTITPTITTQGGQNPGVRSGPGADGDPHPYSITLNRGQCYLVKSWCETTDQDISGTTVTSDKPIFVISAHENAFLGEVRNGKAVEMRDYMVESMIPVEYWDSTGYVAAPMVDSSPITPDDGSPGEKYRIFVYDINNVDVSAKLLGTTNAFNWSEKRFDTAITVNDIIVPIDFYSTNQKKFMVMAYDQRNQGTSGPFPTPSMMSIVPISRWRNACVFATPNDSGKFIPTHYISIFEHKDTTKGAADSVLVSINGGPEKFISAYGFVKANQYLVIPNHPELKCVVYKIPPGTYYAHAKFPFMIYSFGQAANDASNTLGAFDGDDYYFSYANPAAMVLSAGASSPSMSVKIDTLCSSWHICITDHRLDLNKGGIRAAFLLSDSSGDIVTPPDSVRAKGITGYQYANTSFDPKDNPIGNGEINFSGNDSSVCFDVRIDDASKDGYAPVYVLDNGGNAKLIELRFNKARVAYTPPDSQSFGVIQVGGSNGTVIQFINLATSTRSYTVAKAALTNTKNSFEVTAITPTLPALIKPGDTLWVHLRFSANDTSKHYDSILIVTDCFSQTIPISGEGGTPLIVAGDIDFKTVLVGFKKCDTTSVRNVGKLPFTLTSFLLQNTTEFSLDPATVAKLPVTINPGQSFKVTFCYSPTKEGADNTNCIWSTSIQEPYTHSIKDTTKLKGNAVPSAVRSEDSHIGIRLVPNPVGGNEITVFISSDVAEKATVEIFDVLGRQIASQHTDHPSKTAELRFDVRQIPVGTYYARISVGGEVVTRKFEVAR